MLNPRRVLPSRFCFVFAVKNEEKKKTNKKRGETKKGNLLNKTRGIKRGATCCISTFC